VKMKSQLRRWSAKRRLAVTELVNEWVQSILYYGDI
jgi:hypothetical protein